MKVCRNLWDAGMAGFPLVFPLHWPSHLSWCPWGWGRYRCQSRVEKVLYIFSSVRRECVFGITLTCQRSLYWCVSVRRDRSSAEQWISARVCSPEPEFGSKTAASGARISCCWRWSACSGRSYTELWTNKAFICWCDTQNCWRGWRIKALKSHFTCYGLSYHNMEFINGVIKGDLIIYVIDRKGNRKRHTQLGEGILLRNVSKWSQPQANLTFFLWQTAESFLPPAFWEWCWGSSRLEQLW